jgi:hypothetical protein
VRASIRAVLAATVVVLGMGQSPADASSILPTPGLGANVCDGFTGMCTNPLFIRDVVFVADQFSPVPGGSAFPQVWTVGRVKAAEDDLLSAEAGEPFAVGQLRVRPFATGFVSVSTVAFGRFVKSNDPSYPYLFQGVALTHDPDALRRQDFEFIGVQTGPIPEKQTGR